MSKPSKRQHMVYVEVLQNGETLAETSKAFGKRGKIIISRARRGLHIPFYPLTRSIDVLKVTRKGARLLVDSSWNGFVSHKGDLVSYEGKGRKALYLQAGDYASLVKNDLRILVKIAAAVPERPTVVSKEYKGGIAGLLLGSQLERKGIIAALACSGVVFAGLVFGLLSRPDDRPKNFKDLPAEYKLAFINPTHLETIPEALQTNLDRSDLIDQTIDHYTFFSSMILGYDLETIKWLFPNSVEAFKAAHESARSKLDARIRHQAKLDEGVTKSRNTALVRIPTVTGESLQGQILRLQEKSSILHASLAQTLAFRRKTTDSYKSDALYNFNEYRNVEGGAPRVASELSQIKVFDQLTDEQAMYHEARKLAAAARRDRKHIAMKRQLFTPLTRETHRPLGLAGVSSATSFIPPEDLGAMNRKVSIMRPAIFGVKERKVTEPLIGEIDPKLIEKTIQKNRFELQLCYELALRRNQTAKGTMKWQWRLDSRGRINDLVLVSSSIKDPQMKSCVSRKISSWKFPRPKRGSVEITYPFFFKPSKG